MLENEWGEAIVTDTEPGAGEFADSPADASQGQTESEPTTTAAASDDLESRVNHLVELKVSERLATLDTEVQRRVQSELQKRRNQADKQLAEDKRAIERMALRGQIDAQRAQELQAEAEAEANKAKRVWDVDEEPTYQTPAAPTNAPIVPRATIVNYLQGQGLAPTDIETISGRFAGLPDTPQNAQAFMAEVTAAQQRRTPAAPSQEQRVVQQFGGTAAPAARAAGAPSDPQKEMERLLNTDPTKYPGGVNAYEQRLDLVDKQIEKSGGYK